VSVFGTATYGTSIRLEVLQCPSDGVLPLWLVMSVSAIVTTEEGVVTESRVLRFHTSVDMLEATFSLLHELKSTRLQLLIQIPHLRSRHL
jgi:hypothetical protein